MRDWVKERERKVRSRGKSGRRMRLMKNVTGFVFSFCYIAFHLVRWRENKRKCKSVKGEKEKRRKISTLVSINKK